MSEQLGKTHSAEFMRFYARVERDIRTILKCSAIEALRRAREGQYRHMAVSDQVQILSSEIDRMSVILRGKIKKKASR